MSQRKRNQQEVEEDEDPRSAFQPYSRNEPAKKQSTKKGRKRANDRQSAQLPFDAAEFSDDAIHEFMRIWQDNPQRLPSDATISELCKRYKSSKTAVANWFLERIRGQLEMVMQPPPAHYPALMPVQQLPSKDMPMLMPHQPQIFPLPMQGTDS